MWIGQEADVNSAHIWLESHYTSGLAVHGKLSQLFMSCQTWKSSHLSDLAFLCDIFGSVVVI